MKKFFFLLVSVFWLASCQVEVEYNVRQYPGPVERHRYAADHPVIFLSAWQMPGIDSNRCSIIAPHVYFYRYQPPYCSIVQIDNHSVLLVYGVSDRRYLSYGGEVRFHYRSVLRNRVEIPVYFSDSLKYFIY